MPLGTKTEDTMMLNFQDKDEDAPGSVDNGISNSDPGSSADVLPNKINPVLQADIPPVASGGMELSNPPSAKILAPMEPAAKGKPGKSVSPSSVKIWVQAYNKRKGMFPLKGMPTSTDILQQNKLIPKPAPLLHALKHANSIDQLPADLDSRAKAKSWDPNQNAMQPPEIPDPVVSQYHTPRDRTNDFSQLSRGRKGYMGEHGKMRHKQSQDQIYDINWEGINSQVIDGGNTWSHKRDQSRRTMMPRYDNTKQQSAKSAKSWIW